VLVGLSQGVGALAFSFFILFILVYLHNKHQVLVGLSQGVGGLAGLYLFYFILVYFYNAYQVLVGLPQGVGGLAILFYLYDTHQVLVELPQGVGSHVLLFYLFCLYFNQFNSVDFYDAYLVLVGLPKWLVALLFNLFYVILMYFSLFL
jgi:hypothetical protein